MEIQEEESKRLQQKSIKESHEMLLRLAELSWENINWTEWTPEQQRKFSVSRVAFDKINSVNLDLKNLLEVLDQDYLDRSLKSLHQVEQLDLRAAPVA